MNRAPGYGDWRVNTSFGLPIRPVVRSRAVLVRHSMTRHPLGVGPADRCLDVFQAFQQRCIRHAPVLDEGELVGVVSERDLTRALPWLMADLDTRSGPDPLAITVAAVMAREPITCGLNDPIDEVALTMKSARIGCMPVLDQGQLVGMVSVTDLLRGFADHFSRADGRAVTLVWTHGDRLPMPDIAGLCVAHGLFLSTLFDSLADSGAAVFLLRVHGSEPAHQSFLKACGAAHLGVLTRA